MVARPVVSLEIGPRPDQVKQASALARTLFPHLPPGQIVRAAWVLARPNWRQELQQMIAMVPL